MVVRHVNLLVCRVIGKLTISNREISRHSAATIYRLRTRVAFSISGSRESSTTCFVDKSSP
nr:MAG TPA: hypothetical protein [Caudoviricetes sp.]